MQTRRIILSIAILSILAAPLGAAGPWVAWQTTEPDNALDTADFMWQDAPESERDRVYFAAISTYSYVGQVNPNVGALGTNNEPPGGEYHEALLGVWTDCNGDDYIGMAEGALREYSSSLLLDDSLCPPVQGAGTSPNRWTPGANNYRQLVTEFIPIARDPTARDVRVYEDNEAKVWGDFGRYNAEPTQRSCALNPQPRGTYQSTGGTLNYVDCRVDILGTWNAADAIVGLGMSFSDDENAEGSFADFETAGSENSSYAAVSIVDCSAEPMVDTGASLNETGVGGSVNDSLTSGEDTSGLDLGDGWEYYQVTVDTISPRTVNTVNPTAPGQLNQTNEEFFDNCDTSDDRGADFYSGACAIVICVGEADFNGVDPNKKSEADWNFRFSNRSRGGLPFSALGAIGASGSAGYDPRAGLGVSQPITFVGGARWYSDSTWLSKPGPAILKTDLSDPQNPRVGLADAYWLTFYAAVGPATTSLHKLPGGGAPGIYGSWHCGDQTTGVQNGWVCDPDAWYVNPDGTLISGRDTLAKPGDLYHLRDSDCYDGDVGAVEDNTGTAVGILPAFYGDNPCP